MKRILGIGLVIALAAVGCKNQGGDTTARLDKLEQRIEQLEKRPSMPLREGPPPQAKAYNLPIGQSHVFGKKDAPLNIVVFSDYQCPYCGKADPLLRDVVKDPELKDKVNLVFKNFPLSFHQFAKPAAKAALAAGEQGNDKFWAMSEKIFNNQETLTAENFTKWAKEIGLNTTKFASDLKTNDAKYEEAIKSDMELGMKEANVRGTPSIYVAGWELRERSAQGVKDLLKEKKLM